MFKRILVPTDGSESSRRAFRQAAQMAKQLEAQIILLHVVFTPEALGYVLSGGATVVQEQFGINGQAVLDITTGTEDTSGIRLVKKLCPGHPATVIVDEVEKEGVDLVVIGSRGFGPITGSLLGSVSQRVLLKAECPVLVVK